MKLNNKIVIIKGHESFSTGVTYSVANIEIYNKQFKCVADIYVTMEGSIRTEQQAKQALAKHFKLSYTEVCDILRTECLTKVIVSDVKYRELQKFNNTYKNMNIVY